MHREILTFTVDETAPTSAGLLSDGKGLAPLCSLTSVAGHFSPAAVRKGSLRSKIGQIGQIGQIGRDPGTDQEGVGFISHLFIIRGSYSDFVLSMAFVDRVSGVTIRNQD